MLIAVAASDARLGLAAALLYALAYTLELGVSLAIYFGGADRPARHVDAVKLLASSHALWLALRRSPRRGAAGEEEEFDPSHEFELPEWVPIHIGPLDISINKAVVYLCSARLHDRRSGSS